MGVSDKEREKARNWYLNHGVDLKKCFDADEDGAVKYATLWCRGTDSGTVVVAVCEKCRASYDVTDYESW